jgi:hypothetical protein
MVRRSLQFLEQNEPPENAMARGAGGATIALRSRRMSPRLRRIARRPQVLAAWVRLGINGRDGAPRSGGEAAADGRQQQRTPTRGLYAR